MAPHAHPDDLAEAHLLALRLEAAGADTELIARMLEIGPEAVPPLLEVARRKAERRASRTATSDEERDRR